jgi:hypothetical protein
MRESCGKTAWRVSAKSIETWQRIRATEPQGARHRPYETRPAAARSHHTRHRIRRGASSPGPTVDTRRCPMLAQPRTKMPAWVRSHPAGRWNYGPFHPQYTPIVARCQVALASRFAACPPFSSSLSRSLPLHPRLRDRAAWPGCDVTRESGDGSRASPERQPARAALSLPSVGPDVWLSVPGARCVSGTGIHVPDRPWGTWPAVALCKR